MKLLIICELALRQSDETVVTSFLQKMAAKHTISTRHVESAVGLSRYNSVYHVGNAFVKVSCISDFIILHHFSFKILPSYFFCVLPNLDSDILLNPNYVIHLESIWQ